MIKIDKPNKTYIADFSSAHAAFFINYAKIREFRRLAALADLSS
ncbi:hypothetical protein B4144_2182 [Bacillus atrophaeus]|nr:hypothetical protein B4144_2182 [Bacillus atrophaeus]